MLIFKFVAEELIMKIYKKMNHFLMLFLIVFLCIVGTGGSIVLAAASVTIVNMTSQDQFSLQQTNVIAGATVQWVNLDSDAHTATTDTTNLVSGGPDSDVLFPKGLKHGQTYEWVVPVTSAPGTTWYYHCRFHGSSGNGRSLGSGMAGSITVINAALPDIKANGQDGPITVSSNSPISITVGLTGVNQAGTLADWWIVASTPLGFISWSYPAGWTTGLIATFQIQLVNFSPIEMFNGSLPVGNYTFFFGVDTTPDNALNQPLYYDFVQIHVE